MVLNIVVIVFVGVVAYFHYTQGFFTATLSAIFALIAAVLAVSYNETVVHLLIKGSFLDEANAMMLVAIFAVVYTILRVVSDKAIPGNVRTPSTVDKVGAGLMGVIAGIFATGIIAIAIQMLPFSPSLGFMGFKRYPMTDTETVSVPTPDHGQFLDAAVHDRLDDPTFASADSPRNSLWLPADDIVMWTTYRLGDGALPGARPMESIHPAYLDELFTDRLGIETGSIHAALVFKGNESVTVDGVFELPIGTMLAGYDADMPQTRDKGTLTAVAISPAVAKKVKVDPLPDHPTQQQREKFQNTPIKYEVASTKSRPLIVVRVGLTDKSAMEEESQNVFRFSCASVRMVAKNADGQYIDIHPIGTMQPGKPGEPPILMLNAPDDFLFVDLKERNGFDLVFAPDAPIITGGKTPVVADDTFISIKRFANIDLSEMKVSTDYKTSTKYVVARKKTVQQWLNLPEVKGQGDSGDDKNKK